MWLTYFSLLCFKLKNGCHTYLKKKFKKKENDKHALPITWDHFPRRYVHFCLYPHNCYDVINLLEKQ